MRRGYPASAVDQALLRRGIAVALGLRKCLFDLTKVVWRQLDAGGTEALLQPGHPGRPGDGDDQGFRASSHESAICAGGAPLRWALDAPSMGGESTAYGGCG